MSAVFLRRAVLAAAAVALPFSARSDDPLAPDPATVETIVIRADPATRGAERLLRPDAILAGEELDRRRGVTLGETLEHEPGVSTSDFGRGAGRPVIRGQGGPRVLLLDNGIGAMDASDVSSDHAVSIDPAQARQIEILKGPATLLYGSGAAAGVVNVADARLPTTFDGGLRGSLRGGVGSNADERSGSARASYGFAGGTQLGVDAAWLDADDYEPGERGRALPNSAVDRRSGALSLARIGERASVAASYGVFRTEYGLPIERTAFIDLEQVRVDLEARVKRPLPGFEALRLRYGRGDYEHTEFEAPGEPGTVFRNDQDEGRAELLHAPFAGLRGVLGVQRRDREFQAIGDEAFVPSTDSRGLGLFLVERAPTGFGSLEFGLRLDRERNEPRDAARRARRFDPLSLSAGARFELDANHHLQLYATRAQRVPVAEELYAFGPHRASGSFDRGRDDFDLESAHNLELGLVRHRGALDWRLNLYAQRVSHYIFQREVDAGLNADGSGSGARDGVADRVDGEGAFDPAGELLLLDYAAADARFWGAEAQIGYAWDAAQTAWRARAFGDLARGRIDGGEDLPRITPARVGGGLHAQRGPWRASLELTRVLRQDRVASLERPTPGYGLLGADLDWTVATRGDSTLILFLRGRNLLDQAARRHASFIKDLAPLPGASLMLGLEWRVE